MERGEVDGRASVVWSGLKAGWPVDRGRSAHQIRLEEADLPEVPLLVDLATSQRRGRSFVSSRATARWASRWSRRGLAADRIAARAGIPRDDVRPAFLADAEKRGLPIHQVRAKRCKMSLAR
jgi:hypothetical protein